jgi:hypothetical protein
MSPLQMFLPASEPARSEALAALQKSHHLPRHLVRGIARSGKRSSAQMEQQAAAAQALDVQEDDTSFLPLPPQLG